MSSRAVWSRLAAVAVLALCGAATVGAQDLSAIKDAALREAATAELRAAMAKGLPPAPFVAKAMEGQLKHASPERVRSAMRGLATRIELARTQLAPATDAELSAGADALAAGVSGETLRELRRTWPTKSVALPLGVLAELVSRGIAPPKAAKQVLALMNRGATAQQLAALGHDIEDDIRNGRGADAALDLRVRGIMGALAPPAGVTLVPRP